MNIKRGLVRLWIAGSCVWLLAMSPFLYVPWEAYISDRRLVREAIERVTKQNSSSHEQELTVEILRNKANNAIAKAEMENLIDLQWKLTWKAFASDFILLVVIPVAVAWLLLGFGLWIVRGFGKAKP